MTSVGFNKPLYILPFDHRGSFQQKMFGWDGALIEPATDGGNCCRQTGHL